jgi:hypothetical protein
LNIGAMPSCAIVAGIWAVVSTVVFRKQLRRAWEWVKDEIHQPLRAEIPGIRETAGNAHRISADLCRHHTGYTIRTRQAGIPAEGYRL